MLPIKSTAPRDYAAGMGGAQLSHQELGAWRSFTAAHDQLITGLDRQLVQQHELSLSEYEVLARLAEAPEWRLRMHELAVRCGLSPSGLTRRFDSMGRNGLVAREKCRNDRRGVFARLTPHGKEVLERATPTYSAGVHGLFVQLLNTQELDELHRLTERLASNPTFAAAAAG